MKPTSYFKFILAASCGWVLSADARTTVSLDKEWSFFQGEVKGVEAESFDASGWRKVDVPHDWSIEGEFSENAPTTGDGGWLPSGVAWYRKEFTLTPEQANQRVWLEFDGVMANSEVWLNGKLVGKRPNGYQSFRYDVTDSVNPKAANLLVVKADTKDQPASRWYTGAGIYRHVRMVTVDPIHVAPWGVYVTTPKVDAKSATVKVETTVENRSTAPAELIVRSSVVAPDGEVVKTAETPVKLENGKSQARIQEIEVEAPKLWDLESPHLYTLRTEVVSGKTVVDETTTSFGIRHAEFRSDTGFWLNGKNFKIKGVALHADGGAVGAAIPLAVWERRLNLLRHLGVNAIRTAHNQFSPEFLSLCDRKGFLVMDEFFDSWTKGKRSYDYHLHFKEWAHRDLREGLMRDRNHPSIILYSVGNEIHDTPKPDIAKPILRGLVDICHEVDPTRPVTQALFRPNVSGDYHNGLADMLDVVGTNYRDRELLQAWKEKPTRKIIGTEQRHELSTWLDCRDHPQHSGQFLWVGIDYLGESRRWPLTVFNAGLLDRTGVIMPRGEERRSWWSDEPMVSVFRRVGKTEATPSDPGYEVVEWDRRQVLFPDWNPHNEEAHEENVEVYSNAAEVELFLNGKSLGKKPTNADGSSLNWKVAYQPGELKAVAYRDGKEVASNVLRTAGKAEKIELKSDHTKLTTDFHSVANVEIRILDAKGTIVPTARQNLKFSVEGPGKLVAVDSGDVVSTEKFVASERKAYQGRALAIVRATGVGKITLKVEADGLPAATIELAGE
ncbi:MAG: glycoside hydrolase family 2 TIM barrel-domain containing protein [Luteolibacter sp.]